MAWAAGVPEQGANISGVSGFINGEADFFGLVDASVEVAHQGAAGPGNVDTGVAALAAVADFVLALHDQRTQGLLADG